ncbi:hypothetical protein NEDG_00449 [Nematocida displodere]|uniref:Uncharacterized protein n=1 Tax=Nematocida displodere TaxID=1805483 RepID=A0A177EJ21_9MICR|nr:hypothetical protein NEDG_00449 [Nematocida displodere]
MTTNPFQAHQPKHSLEHCLGGVLGASLPRAPIEKTKPGTSPKQAPSLSEKALLQKLSVPARPKAPLSTPAAPSVFNAAKATLTPEAKAGIELTLKTLIYYQVPETHTVKKEEGNAFKTIFLNWRQGLAGVFAQYRKACINKEPFFFFAYTDGATCFFHTPGYQGCAHPCCSGKKYALSISGLDPQSSLLSDGAFAEKSGVFYLSGPGVLFILDSILNTEASTIHPLPFIISKTPFLHGICTKPAISFRAEKSTVHQMFRASATGWMLGTDFPELILGSCFSSRTV